MKSQVLWDVIRVSTDKYGRRFEGMQCLHFQRQYVEVVCLFLDILL